jgi:hypothetical protein
MTKHTRRWWFGVAAAAVYVALVAYCVSIGWQWNRPVNLDNLLLVVLAGVIAPLVTVLAFRYRSVLFAFLMGPAWVAFVYVLAFWNDGNGPPTLLLGFTAAFVVVIGLPLGAGLAVVVAVVRFYEGKGHADNDRAF